MATHSSVLACGIPWTEEPGGLSFMGPQRVRQDRSHLARTHTVRYIEVEIRCCTHETSNATSVFNLRNNTKFKKIM